MCLVDIALSCSEECRTVADERDTECLRPVPESVTRVTAVTRCPFSPFIAGEVGSR